MVKGILRRKAHQPIPLIRPKLSLLVKQRRLLAQLLHLAKVKLVLFKLGKVIHGPRVLGRNVVNLRKVLFLDDRVINMRQHLRRILMQILTRLLAHNAPVQIPGLVVLADFPFVVIMALARDDVVRDFVRRLGDVGPVLVREAVGRILLVARVVGVDAHGAVEVDGGVGARHEGAVGRHLVQVDADAVVLRVAVEEHAELEQRVGRVFDSRDHGAWGKGGLLNVAVVVFRVFVEDQAAEVVHLCYHVLALFCAG